MHCAAYNECGSGDVMKYLLETCRETPSLDLDAILNSYEDSRVCALFCYCMHMYRIYSNTYTYMYASISV